MDNFQNALYFFNAVRILNIFCDTIENTLCLDPLQGSMEQYKILGRIGEGAHGIVFKAKHIEVCKDHKTLWWYG